VVDAFPLTALGKVDSGDCGSASWWFSCRCRRGG
jgi:hypothetical protein